MKDREQLAWAAGFFDGEGHTQARPVSHRPIGRVKPQMCIAQAGSSELLYRFRDVVGVGRVYGPYRPKTKNSRSYWQWSAASFEDVQAVIAMLWPWLGAVKRSQAKDSLLAVRNQRPKMKSGPKPRGELVLCE